MKIHGPTSITFPEKYPLKGRNHEDGRSGPAFQSFPIGTISAAVPGQKYNFTITARCNSGNGRFIMNVSCSDWGTKSQYSKLSGSESQIFSHMFGSSFETIYGSYIVPEDDKAWFLQGVLEFLDSTDYDIKLFSVKREQTSNKTENFHLHLGDSWYNFSGILSENEIVNFSVDPTKLCDSMGVMNFTAFIDGNKFGIVNLIYKEPILFCRNARFKVNSYNEHIFNLSITKTTSKFSKIFKIVPFSTDSIYDFLNIKSDDNSNIRHVSKNGNIWLSCDCPDIEENYIEISFYGGIIRKPKQKFLYLFDKEIKMAFLRKIIIFGKINIEVNAIDSDNVSKVEFYIDNIKEFTDDSPPYEWLWNKITFFRHNVMVRTYYKNGYISEDKIDLWKFF